MSVTRLDDYREAAERRIHSELDAVPPNMNKRSDANTLAELLLADPEIVAWLDDRRDRADSDAADDDGPPHAA